MSRPLNIAKEVAFWRLQIEEHMLFIYQGLVDDLSILKLKEQAVALHQLWHDVDGDVMPLIDETLKFQNLILNKITYGPWIGWLSMSFVNHLIKETEYFKKKLLGEMTHQDEVKFWLWHHHSESAAAEKLLDPTEQELSLLLKDYMDYIKVLETDLLKSKKRNGKISPETRDVLEEYLDNNTALEKGILNYTIYSNISPILINHVIREGYYAIELFK